MLACGAGLPSKVRYGAVCRRIMSAQESPSVARLYWHSSYVVLGESRAGPRLSICI